MIVDACVTKVEFLSSDACLVHPQNLADCQIAAKIKQYFCDFKLKFDLPLHSQGTTLHRVVAAVGLGGYCGGKDNKKFIKIKEWLLNQEQS